MNHFILIGISDNPKPELSSEVKKIIASHRIFSGGKRHFKLIRDFLPEEHQWLNISVPITDVLEQYKGISDEPIVVFVSGDPLFYGFAITLQREFPEAKLEVFPYFNSLQLLAQKCAYRYASMVNTSITGRPWDELDRALIEGKDMIGVLTDRKKTPTEIAHRLLDYGYNNYEMTIGEALGGKEEKILKLSLKQAANRAFHPLNCVILHKTAAKTSYFGIPEEEFHHLEGRPKMITKMPIRLLSLSMLDLPNRKVFWDIGFCTGSISIDARLHFPYLHIFSFEIRQESKQLFDLNTRKFGTPGINPFIGNFLEQDLDNIPKPDAVFIGGHGGKLNEIITLIAHHLNPDGIIVINSVAQDSKSNFLSTCKELGFKITQQHEICLDNHNPITLIAAQQQ